MSWSTLSVRDRSQLAARGLLAPGLIFGLLFVLAGRWDYWPGWVYVVLNTVILAGMAVVSSGDVALVKERLRPGQGMKTWDKVYFALSTPMYFLALVLGGLDARFGWTGELPLPIYLGAVGVSLLGQAIFLWARFTNRYFSSVVRIQADRGQTVCKDGPYRYVRHPGYVGGFLFAAAMGLVLGSVWATLPQILACGLLVWRTGLEDKMLQAELPGYAAFAKETRYRLAPGVW